MGDLKNEESNKVENISTDTSNSTGDAAGYSLLSGFDSWLHLFRFILGIGVPLIILIWFILYGAKELTISEETVRITWDQGSSGEIQIGEIRLLTSGLQIKSSDNSLSYSQITVPGNRVWFRTGVSVENGDILTFRASGSVVLAAHLLVEDYANPTIRQNAVPWFRSTPAGRLMSNQGLIKRAADEFRRGMTPYPEADIGQLIGVVVPQSMDENRVERPSAKNFQPDGVFFIGDGGKHTYSSKNAEPGILYLAVNDLVANFDDPSAESLWLLESDPQKIRGSYFPDGNVESQILSQKITDLKLVWDQAKSGDNRDVFYQDNLGSYTVVVFASGNEN